MIEVASTAAMDMPVDNPVVRANEVAVLLSVASISSTFAVMVPPEAEALVVPPMVACDSTPEKAPPKPTEPDTAVVFGSELPVNVAWMFTWFPLAVSDPPATDAVTFGWIVSLVLAAAPAAAIAP